MGARTSSTVKRARGDLSRDHSPLEEDVASPPIGTAVPCLSIVHFELDQDERALEDEPSAFQERRSRAVHDAIRLASIIEQRIVARTLGRIRNLKVACQAGHVTIRGQCATFYTKQLAQHAAMGVIEDETVVNEITVGFCR